MTKEYVEGRDAREQIPQIVGRWFIEQCANPYGHFHLFIKPSPDARLVIAEEAPEGFELAMAERISPAWELAQAETMVYRWARRLPVIG